MRIRNYAIRNMSEHEEKLTVTVLADTPDVADYYVSKGICCHSFVHLKCTKKVWKEVKSKLGLKIFETYVEFDERD